MKSSLTSLTLVAGLFISGAAQASLIDRGGGLIYDDVLNITWLQDANLAASNTFGLGYNTNLGDYPDDSWAANYIERVNTDGSMTWGAALHWIDAMNATSYLGYDDWRLPDVMQSDPSCSNQNDAGALFGTQSTGYGCTGSEMAHLFHVDGGLSTFQSVLSSSTLTGLFSNMQSSVYWYGLEFAPSTSSAWFFYMDHGGQSNYNKDDYYYAWAVRPGDVAAAPAPSGVPEPATLGLLALGLLGLGLTRRRG